MIELFIILVLAAAGWLVWTGKLDLKTLINRDKQVSSTHPAPTQSVSAPPQSNAATPAPVAPQPEPAIATPIQAPAPSAESIAELTPPTPATIDAPAVAVPVQTETAPVVPEDSVLKRHYLAALQAQKDALSTPYPTDSVLRRHYDALRKIDLPQPLQTPTHEATEPAQSATNDAETATVSTETTHDRSEVESPAIPTDSVLKRHYAQLKQASAQ